MNGGHYLGFAVLFILGYVAARYFPRPGQMVGLP